MKLAQTLTPDNRNKTVFLNKSAAGEIKIQQTKHETWLFVDDIAQSAIANEPPFRPLFPHTYVMLLPLSYDVEPNSILELGGGGLSINRYLSHSRPSITITSVEKYQAVVDAVETHFPTLTPLNVVSDEAFSFLRQHNSANFGWIIVDVFNGADSGLNDDIEQLLQLAFARLVTNGWIIFNALDTSASNIASLNSAFERAFGHRPFRFAVPNMQNQIMMATRNPDFQFPPEILDHDLNNSTSS